MIHVVLMKRDVVELLTLDAWLAEWRRLAADKRKFSDDVTASESILALEPAGERILIWLAGEPKTQCTAGVTEAATRQRNHATTSSAERGGQPNRLTKAPWAH